jgi:hypothetical protein
MATTLNSVTITGTRDSDLFSISKFRTQVGNLARPNYFIAELAGYKDKLGANIDDTFKFRCEKAELPGRTIATADDAGGGGTSLKLPYDVTYSDIQLSIICSEDMKERIFFENWIDQIVNPAGYDTSTVTYEPGLVGFYDNYAKGISLLVTQLNAEGKSLLIYELMDVYPIALTPMNATWEEVNSYQRFGVTLAYRYHTVSRPASAG